MNLLLWSFHIRNVGVDGLKTITKSIEQIDTLRSVMDSVGASECYYLATCNRVEFLFYTSGEFIDHPPAFTDLKPEVFNTLDRVTQHMMEVACSMDSVVFGENQILGQIKTAFTEQQKRRMVGPGIARFLNLILRETKKIRTETQLARLQTSVSSVAGKMIHQKIGNKASVLLVGYGESHKLLHKYLEKKGFTNISVTNRTAANINSQDLNCQIVKWDNFLKANLEHFDVVSFATASTDPLLTKEMLKVINPKLVVDLCIPPNADKHLVAAESSAAYLGLDYIQQVLSKDQQEADELKTLLRGHISSSVLKILSDLSVHSINDLITVNIQKSLRIHEEHLINLDSVFDNLTVEQKLSLAQWSEKLIKKINHVHLKTYKEVVNAVQTQGRDAQK